MRKHLSEFAACVLFALMLAGCGQTQTQTQEIRAEAPAVVTPRATPSPALAPTPVPEPEDSDLVLLRDYLPSVFVDLKYATTENFTGTVIYDFTDASLRYGTVKKLAAAQAALLQEGYCLKIWDAYRPVRAQFRLWEVCPNPVYVANPNTGDSSHSKGNTVDITLVRADGAEVPMPSGFDDFSALADRDYSDVSQESARNAALLEQVLEQSGFIGYSGEWWHYSDATDYPVLDSD